MGLSAPLTDTGRLPLGKLHDLYDQHRFLDAWKASAALWVPSTDVDQLSIDELIFAARLAVRVGGSRLSRSLFRKARKREPANPLVRYFTNHLDEPRKLLLDELVAFESNPKVCDNDDQQQANWLGAHAYTWALLRNRARAQDLLQQAHALSPDSAWLYSLEANAHGFADDWQSSLRSAERAWELDPRSSWAGTSLATALLNLGQIQESVRYLTLATENTQSIQLVQSACWHQCAIAEVLEGDDRSEALAKARALTLQLEPLSPLADKEFKNAVARAWLDIAQLADDRAEMERWTTEARSPFHRQVLANLKRNPDGRRIRLPYLRTVQKHLECVPTSVSSALSATGIDVSVEELAADVTFGGTAEWAAADWLRNKGLHVRLFAATPETAAKLIDAGIGFVVSWDADDSGHAVAIVGMDHAAGVAVVHDPTSFRSTEYLLCVFDPGSSPLGVLGMAAVTAERANELDGILPPEAAIVEAAQAQLKALTLYEPSTSSPIVADIVTRFPSHPGTKYLQAIQGLEEGRMGRALASFRELFDRFPNAPALRARLMNACRAMGDTALLRHTLQTVAETGSIPGVESQSDWIRPHPRYVCEYADLLRSSSETKRHATTLLRSVLNRNWASSAAWHILADLRWDQRDIDSALLAYSIASFLAPHNEHYARAYVDVLCQNHRIEEGLRWLENRVQEMGSSSQGASTWITWIGVLEDRGYPERAIAACENALVQHESVTALQAFAVPFLARMGRWDDAEKQLHFLESGPSKAAFHEAAVAFHRMSGQTAAALQDAEAWVAEIPRSMAARYTQLDLISSVYGQNAAAARAAEWMREHPANEDFEQAFCQHAQNNFYWRKIRVLRMRVKRNREDSWAWRELVFSSINAFERADQTHRNRLRTRIEANLVEVDRLAAGNSATIRAHGLWKEAQGDWNGAVDRYLETIRSEPDHFYAYRRAWECSARLSEQKRRALWDAIEPVYLNNSCHLPNSLEMMRLLAVSFGPREVEKIVEGWRRRRPDDPNVLEAAADLLLDNGHGRSDGLRALELLLAAVYRFPYHSGLRFSLARACRATGDYEGANKVFEELVRRRPDNTAALTQLAWIQKQEGNTQLALETLERASLQEPQQSGPFDTRAQILIEENRYEAAQKVLQDGLTALPDSVGMYQRAIQLFNQCGQPAKAVEAARQGVRAYPHGAYLWLLLGKTLKDSPQFAASGEIEACLRKSVQLNCGLFEAADWLAMLLVEQRNDKEAIDLLSAIEPKMHDPSPVLGRLAWVKRRSGAKQEAVTDLAAVLRNAPWYDWGWKLLLSWLDEDKNWASCRDLLQIVPPQMMTDVGFRQGRLLLLEKHKVDSSSTNAEWDELLADFPEDVDLHLRRFDSLQGAGHPADAASVLRRINSIAADNVYFLARLAHVECQEKKFGGALEHALTVCFAATEPSPWPADQVWEHLHKAGMSGALSEQFLARLRDGARPTRRALVHYADRILDQRAVPLVPKWIRNSWLNHSTRQVTKLTRLLEQSKWLEGIYVADMMSVLNRRHYQRLALSWWNRLRAKGLESNSDVWAQAGRSMVNLGKKRAAKQLLKDWRTRTGIGMWVLANYLLCLSRLRSDDLKEVIATCRGALAGLPHDHCARYLAYMEAEACVLAGDKPRLIDASNRYARYFEGLPDKEDFFPTQQRYLVHEILDAVRLVQEQDNSGFRRLQWKLRLQRFWSQQIRAKSKSYLVLFIRVAIFLWFLGMAIASFFK
jgi:tetratricopeptide (TPR) repeat protein